MVVVFFFANQFICTLFISLSLNLQDDATAAVPRELKRVKRKMLFVDVYDVALVAE